MRLRLWTRLWWVPVVGCLAAAVQAAEEPILQLETGGHTAICNWVGFTPDGTRLVSAGEDKVVRVWNVTDPTQPRLERSLRFQIGSGHEGKIHAAAIAPKMSNDGRMMFAVGGYFDVHEGPQRGDIRLVDFNTGEVLGLLRGHTKGVLFLAFSTDGRFLASCSADATVRVWDVGSAKWEIGKIKVVPSAVLMGHTAAVNGLAFVRSPPVPREAGNPRAERESYRVASASDDQTLRLWNRNAKGEWTTSATLKGHTAEVRRVVCSPDGLTLASSSADRSVRLWDSRTGQFQQKLCEVSGVLGRSARIAFSPDGQHLVAAAGSLLGGSRIWRVADGKEVARFDGHDNAVQSVAVQGSPPAPREAARGENSAFSATGVIGNKKRQATFTPRIAERDDYLVASTGGNNNDIFLWDGETGRQFSHIVGTGRSVFAVAFSANGQRIAFGNTNLGLEITATSPIERFFDLSTLEPDPPQTNFSTTGFARAMLTHGGLSAAQTAMNRLTVRRGEREIAAIACELQNDEIRCYTFVPSGRSAGQIAIGSNFSLTLHDAATGKELHEFIGHTGQISAVAVSPDGRWLVSGSHDQTFRLWNIQTGELLLTVFVGSDNEWVVWTPQGYHKASPGGQRLIGWHVNRGEDKAAEFFTAAQFGKSLYRPDILAHVLETGSVAEAVKLADQERGKQITVKKIEDALPPTVRLTSPASGTPPLDRSTLTVTATAGSRGVHPVTMLKLLVDGRPHEGQKGERKFDSPKLGEVQGTWTVELSVGKHRLQVLADSAVSQGKSDEVTVSYIGGGAEPVLLPKLYVVAIGISEYPGSLKLNYAAKDAEVFVRTIGAGGKPLFRQIETKLLTDKQATRAEVLKSLTWLRQQMTQNDFGIFFFAGHGEKDSDGALYFLPVDADTNDLLSSAVPSEQIKRSMTSIPGKLMLMLDACHSGGLDAPANSKRRAAGSLTDDLVRDLINDENGLIVMCSSTGREFSLENNEHRHGNFTLAVNEGLSGKADFNKDGSVYITELDLYVTDRVKELSKGQQHPVTGKPVGLRSFPLSKTKP